MESAESGWTALVGHSSTLGDATRGIDAYAQAVDSGRVVCRYRLRADFSRVRIPPAQGAERVDGLWRHTCFEAFIKAPGGASYYEFNFAPSGKWAAYRFNAYREGMVPADLGAPPEIAVRRFDDRLELDAALRLDDGTVLRGAPHLDVALTAVIEEENGRLSYWALKHAPGKADFHHPDAFVLRLSIG